MSSGQCYSINFANFDSSDRDTEKASTLQYCESVGLEKTQSMWRASDGCEIAASRSNAGGGERL
jgi:hypothetical protein